MSVRSTYRFARIPQWILIHPKLNGTDIRIFGILDRYDGKECIPGFDAIANQLRCSRDTVRNAIRHLESVGALVREIRLTDEGRQTSNRYVLAGDTPLTPGGEDSHPSGGEDLHPTRGEDSHPNPEQEEREQEEPPMPVAEASGRGVAMARREAGREIAKAWYDAIKVRHGTPPTAPSFMAVAKMAEKALAAHEPQSVLDALVGLYEDARPISGQTLDQRLNGRKPKTMFPSDGRRTAPGMARLQELMKEARGGG